MIGKPEKLHVDRILGHILKLKASAHALKEVRVDRRGRLHGGQRFGGDARFGRRRRCGFGRRYRLDGLRSLKRGVSTGGGRER
jgi:hypothetical protein